MQIHIVSATRRTKDEFWNTGALGLSLKRLAHDQRLTPWIAYENKQGLPDIYNQVIAPHVPAGAVVFAHDDIWLDDIFFGDRILDGLKHFDVIGLAGNKRRIDHQPGWAFPTKNFHWDESKFLSGRIAHGEHAFGKVTDYGESPARCELLDGVLLASTTESLLRNECRFDPRFKFHFYDLDFCRSATQVGLRLGTWPIGVTHQSGGAFATPTWWDGYRTYIDKWQT
jgi:hypothetical protein